MNLPGPGPSNRPWFVPHLYLRPRYMFVVTPIGSLRIDSPPEEVAAACTITLLVLVIGSILLCPKRCCFPLCCCKRQRKCQCRCKSRQRPSKRYVLLLTDIGLDIDDTLALLVLNALRRQQKVEIVGVVTAGGASVERACIVRGWLRRFGIFDEDVPVAACDSNLSLKKKKCSTPAFAPDKENAALYDKSRAAELILKLARKYSGNLEVFALCALTPLAEALELPGGPQILRQGVKTLYIQGNWRPESEKSDKMAPNFDLSYNLQYDKNAATRVFNELQCASEDDAKGTHPNFWLLGKFAAYQVKLTRKDFQSWDKILNQKNELLSTARKQLYTFCMQDNKTFSKLYADGIKTDDAFSSWFDGYKGGISYPYDPLLVLSAFKPELFTPILVGPKSNLNGHYAIGNTESLPGVEDKNKVHERLSLMISAGLEGVVERSRFPKVPYTRASCCPCRERVAHPCSAHHFM